MHAKLQQIPPRNPRIRLALLVEDRQTRHMAIKSALSAGRSRVGAGKKRMGQILLLPNLRGCICLCLRRMSRHSEGGQIRIRHGLLESWLGKGCCKQDPPPHILRRYFALFERDAKRGGRRKFASSADHSQGGARNKRMGQERRRAICA